MLQSRVATVVSLFTITLTMGLLLACNRSHDGASSPKFRQYYNQGEALYLQHCSNCHQKDGTGLGRLYPPLNKADYLKNFNDVICLIRNGKEGKIVVNGIDYNQAMPAITQLTDLEVAQIATYIYNSWENEGQLVEVKDATAILNRCETQP